MGEMLRRILWFFVVACAVAYASFLLLGKVVNAQASGQNEPVVIRDELQPAAHNLSGMVEVASSCDELMERSVQLSAVLFKLEFTSWQEPSVNCDGQQTPRHFHDTVFAPATGVDFIATLNGTELPIFVMPVVNTNP